MRQEGGPHPTEKWREAARTAGLKAEARPQPAWSDARFSSGVTLRGCVTLRRSRPTSQGCGTGPKGDCLRGGRSRGPGGSLSAPTPGHLGLTSSAAPLFCLPSFSARVCTHKPGAVSPESSGSPVSDGSPFLWGGRITCRIFPIPMAILMKNPFGKYKPGTQCQYPQSTG